MIPIQSQIKINYVHNTKRGKKEYFELKQRKRERERDRESVCVCERERKREREIEREIRL